MLCLPDWQTLLGDWWYLLAGGVGLLILVRHIRTPKGHALTGKARYEGAARVGAEAGANIVSIYGYITLFIAVWGKIPFASLESKKSAICIGALWGLLNALAKLYGSFRDGLEAPKA